MFHVSFRYIFGIPPLILALLPATSSDCDIKGKEGKEYENILVISFNELKDPRKINVMWEERKQESAISNK
uniref:Interleukin-7 n=1 Tax=Sciurus vulgaris TaxID=55149 RepID=A0A8D2ALY3_SCIVU